MKLLHVPRGVDNSLLTTPAKKSASSHSSLRMSIDKPPNNNEAGGIEDYLHPNIFDVIPDKRLVIKLCSFKDLSTLEENATLRFKQEAASKNFYSRTPETFNNLPSSTHPLYDTKRTPIHSSAKEHKDVNTNPPPLPLTKLTSLILPQLLQPFSPLPSR